MYAVDVSVLVVVVVGDVVYLLWSLWCVVIEGDRALRDMWYACMCEYVCVVGVCAYGYFFVEAV